MSPYILLSRLYGLAELPFYGAHDTKTPMVANLALALFYGVLMVILYGWWGVYGLAIARSVSYLWGVIILMIFIHRRYGSLGWAVLAGYELRVLGASAVFALAIYSCQRALAWIGLPGAIWNLFSLGFTGVVGLVVFCWAAVLTGALDRSLLRRGANLLRERFGIQPTPTDG